MLAFLCRCWFRSAVTRRVGPALLTITALLAGGCRDRESGSLSSEPTGPVNYLAFSPDGGTVVARSYWVEVSEHSQKVRGFHQRLLGVVRTWDVTSGKPVLSSGGAVREFETHNGTAFELPQMEPLVVSSDGRRLAYFEYRRLRVRGTATGENPPGFGAPEGESLEPVAE